MVVMPYMAKPGTIAPALADVRPRLVQGQSIGYDGVDDYLPVPASSSRTPPGCTRRRRPSCTIGLILMAQRDLVDFVHQQDRAEWTKSWSRGLADRRVLLLGYGGVGKAIAARLAPFEVEVVLVASSVRTEDGVAVHAISDLPELAAGADILSTRCPAARPPASSTTLILQALPNDALVVNIGRGPTVDRRARRRPTARPPAHGERRVRSRSRSGATTRCGRCRTRSSRRTPAASAGRCSRGSPASSPIRRHGSRAARSRRTSSCAPDPARLPALPRRGPRPTAMAGASTTLPPKFMGATDALVSPPRTHPGGRRQCSGSARRRACGAAPSGRDRPPGE